MVDLLRLFVMVAGSVLVTYVAVHLYEQVRGRPGAVLVGLAFLFYVATGIIDQGIRLGSNGAPTWRLYATGLAVVAGLVGLFLERKAIREGRQT
jgi:hypothetical protein